MGAWLSLQIRPQAAPAEFHGVPGRISRKFGGAEKSAVGAKAVAHQAPRPPLRSRRLSGHRWGVREIHPPTMNLRARRSIYSPTSPRDAHFLRLRFRRRNNFPDKSGCAENLIWLISSRGMFWGQLMLTWRETVLAFVGRPTRGASVQFSPEEIESIRAADTFETAALRAAVASNRYQHDKSQAYWVGYWIGVVVGNILWGSLILYIASKLPFNSAIGVVAAAAGLSFVLMLIYSSMEKASTADMIGFLIFRTIELSLVAFLLAAIAGFTPLVGAGARESLSSIYHYLDIASQQFADRLYGAHEMTPREQLVANVGSTALLAVVTLLVRQVGKMVFGGEQETA